MLLPHTCTCAVLASIPRFNCVDATAFCFDLVAQSETFVLPSLV